jgi:hypothetical protein
MNFIDTFITHFLVRTGEITQDLWTSADYVRNNPKPPGEIRPQNLSPVQEVARKEARRRPQVLPEGDWVVEEGTTDCPDQ